MEAECALGVLFVRLACGEPPEGCKVDVMWHEHELGSYTTVGLWWELPARDVPWNYYTRAERTLSRFNDAVDWSKLWETVEEHEATEPRNEGDVEQD